MGSSVDSLQGWLLLACIILLAHSVSIGLRPANIGPTSAPTDSSAESLSLWNATPWKHIGTYKQVETFVKKVPGSALHAFRGTTLLKDVHISVALAHFYDITLAKDWIDVLEDIHEYSYPPPSIESTTDTRQCKERSDSVSSDSYHLQRRDALKRMQPLTEDFKEVDLVHEVMKLPWPVSPRDILLRRHWNYDTKNRTVTIKYDSVEDAVRCPIQPGRVRAVSPHTQWKFYARGKDTFVDIECLVDSKGSIPPVIINLFQRSFPSDSLTAFANLARKNVVPPLKMVIDW